MGVSDGPDGPDHWIISNLKINKERPDVSDPSYIQPQYFLFESGI